MPEIDVSDVVLDPMIAGDKFSVIRRKQVVDEHGMARMQIERIDGVRGSVMPTGENSLIREEALQSQTNTIKVITRFRLRSATETGTVKYQPDLVLWKGDYYVVRELNSWAAFGYGFVEAECSSYDFVDQADKNPPVP